VDTFFDPHGDEARTKIVKLLDENRVLSVATLRPDGWPQATMVGFVHDDLTLYFAVARTSQKLANIQRDPRVSITLGRQEPHRLRGLSMAANAAEVMDLEEIARLNALIEERYPYETVFSPRAASAAVILVLPIVVSVIDLARTPGEPDLVSLNPELSVHSVRLGMKGRPDRALAAGEEPTVEVHYTRDGAPRTRDGDADRKRGQDSAGDGA
jgi:general stress protein 26